MRVVEGEEGVAPITVECPITCRPGWRGVGRGGVRGLRRKGCGEGGGRGGGGVSLGLVG